MMSTPQSQPSEKELTQQLQHLKTQLNKKQTFEPSILTLKTLLLTTYQSSSLQIRTLFYDIICRVATILRTRYTFPHYLTLGLQLLQLFSRFTVNPNEITRIRSLINDIDQTLISQNQQLQISSNNGGGYLFEGHLTVDPEPPQPNWLVQQNLLTALASVSHSRETENGGDDVAGSLMRGLVESLEASMVENIEDFMAVEGGGGGGGRRVAPPASKEVVEKLPVVKVADEKEGEECCVCKEKLELGVEMQEMPCKHLFHPGCLKPWLEEHNSCPICRHELPTDDHKYESWKEREKELEEERRGAANAVRGGEFMYI